MIWYQVTQGLNPKTATGIQIETPKMEVMGNKQFVQNIAWEWKAFPCFQIWKKRET